MSAEKSSIPNYKLQKKLARRRSIRESWPLLVWLGVVAAAYHFYQADSAFSRTRGIVTKTEEVVVAPMSGILKEVEGISQLKQGAPIAANQVIAEFDVSMVDLQIKAEKEKVMADLLDLEHQNQSRLPELELKVANIQTKLEEVRNNITAQETYKRQVESQLKAGSATRADVAKVEAAIGELANELKATESELSAAEAAKSTVIAAITAVRDQKTARAQAVSSAEIELLEKKKERAVIKTRESGFLQRIKRFPGDYVKEGEEIAEIVVERPLTVTAFIPEDHAHDLDKIYADGSPVYVAIDNGAKDFHPGKILSLAPALSQIPDLFSQVNGRMARGRIIEIGELDGLTSADLIAGSQVLVSVAPPSKAPLLTRLFQ